VLYFAMVHKKRTYFIKRPGMGKSAIAVEDQLWCDWRSALLQIPGLCKKSMGIFGKELGVPWPEIRNDEPLQKYLHLTLTKLEGLPGFGQKKVLAVLTIVSILAGKNRTEKRPKPVDSSPPQLPGTVMIEWHGPVNTCSDDVEWFYENEMTDANETRRQAICQWISNELNDWWTVDKIRQSFLPQAQVDQVESLLEQTPFFVSLQPIGEEKEKLYTSTRALNIKLAASVLRLVRSSASPRSRNSTRQLATLIGKRGYRIPIDVVHQILQETQLSETDKEYDKVIHDFSLLKYRVALCKVTGLAGSLELNWSDSSGVSCTMHLTDLASEPRQNLSSPLEALTDREAYIFRQRKIQKETLETIASRLKLTRERVRQIEASAIESIQRPSQTRKMRRRLAVILANNIAPRVIDTQQLVDIARSVTNEDELTETGAASLLATYTGLEVSSGYNDTFFLISLPNIPNLKLPELENWNLYPHIPESEFYEVLRALNPAGVTREEMTRLYKNAVRMHRKPRSLKTAILRTLQLFDKPVHFRDITMKTRVLFPEIGGVTQRSVNSLLLRLHPSLVERPTPARYLLKRELKIESAETLRIPVQETPRQPFFGSIDPSLFLVKQEQESIEQETAMLAAYLWYRLEKLHTPRSICELSLTAREYERISMYCENVDGETLRMFLDGYNTQMGVSDLGTCTFTEGVGLVLTTFLAECARRFTGNGILWPTMKRHFMPSVQRLLFIGNGLSPAFREALDFALRKFTLRHVLDIPHTQNLYVSLHLQFGFSEQSISHIPSWLSGLRPPPTTFSYLLDGHLFSDSFCQLWQAFKDRFYGRISSSVFLSLLEHNPWVPPGGVDRAVQSATNVAIEDLPDIGDDFDEDDIYDFINSRSF
jgi:hypothetical protein